MVLALRSAHGGGVESGVHSGAVVGPDEQHVIAAAVGDGDALVSESLRLRPDLVIADIRMPPSHTDEGLRAAIAVLALLGWWLTRPARWV